MVSSTYLAQTKLVNSDTKGVNSSAASADHQGATRDESGLLLIALHNYSSLFLHTAGNKRLQSEGLISTAFFCLFVLCGDSKWELKWWQWEKTE